MPLGNGGNVVGVIGRYAIILISIVVMLIGDGDGRVWHTLIRC